VVPIPHNVYLHDTPARKLFAKSTRDFSSGCIRIERPLDLAAFLLEQDVDWSVERIKAALATQKEQTVRLSIPVPVHIQYWTAWVDVDGVVSFRKDLYARDDRVAIALRQAPPAIQQ
jgi:murein L,D-transpeptidase YcbB/YkuD